MNKHVCKFPQISNWPRRGKCANLLSCAARPPTPVHQSPQTEKLFLILVTGPGAASMLFVRYPGLPIHNYVGILDNNEINFVTIVDPRSRF